MESCENNNFDEEPRQSEHILSVYWESASLAASFYKMDTRELFVMQEVIELRPMYSILHNLFRQLNPICVLASGIPNFLKEVMNLMNLPDDAEPHMYNVRRNDKAKSKNFVVYPASEKTVIINRKRVLGLDLPGMPNKLSESNKQIYLDAILPMKQNLVIQCLGNLLNYIDDNWRILFSRDNEKPIFTDLSIYSMESQILLDDVTYNVLQIFSNSEHPSGFKHGSKSSVKEGFSIYGLLNRCNSKMGSNEMKMILQQPIKDISELSRRHATIEWCRDKQNFQILTKLQRYLKNIHSIPALFSKMTRHPGNPYPWRTFKKTITNAYLICETCREIVRRGNGANFLDDIIEISQNDSTVKVVILALEDIVDIDEGIKQNRFIVKEGIDEELDQLKRQLCQIQNILPESAKEEISHLQGAQQAMITLIPEMGFLLAVSTFDENERLLENTNNSISFIMKSKNTFFYRNSYCSYLNENFGNLYPEIHSKENMMCKNLLNFLQAHIGDLQTITKLCSKLDCMMAMAIVAEENNYVRPEMRTDKTLNIEDGRHPLLELKTSFVPNNTNVTLENKNLITIITAPNSSGKTVYMKQIGLIVYMAHIGSFVPAKLAQIPVLNSIYSRIYSPESLHQEVSSFLADIHQMGKVMMNSCDRSLILVDEFGKGTNINEGRAILAACIDHLNERDSAAPITFVTTHYLDISDLLRQTYLIRSETIKTKRNAAGETISTFKIVEGKSTSRYATKLSAVQRLLESDFSKSFNGSSSSINSGRKGLLLDELAKKKIHLAQSILQSHQNGSKNLEEIFKKFEGITIKGERKTLNDTKGKFF